MKKYFVIRVRLEKATDRQYLNFSKTMEANGYSYHIYDKNGVRWLLPTGNFTIETTEDKYAILEHVEKIIITGWNKRFQVLVTETNPKGNAWGGHILEG